MIACITLLDLEGLVKVASTMKMLMFTLVNLAVIFMRESRIVSYKPTFRTPGYPYVQIAGVLAYAALISQMGRLTLIISGIFFLFSAIWFVLYVRPRVSGESAFVRMVSHITNKEIGPDPDKLIDELLEILRDRDEVVEDRFDTLIRGAKIVDMKGPATKDEFFTMVARIVSERWNIDADSVERKLHERENQASTLIYPGVAVPHAIPHIVIEGEHSFDIIPVRNKAGITWNEQGEVVYTAFCLLGSKDERNFHLKALMSIAQILQDPDFHPLWHRAKNEEELRSVILLTKRKRHSGA